MMSRIATTGFTLRFSALALAAAVAVGTALSQEGQPAPERSGLTVERAVIAGGVENREPVGEAESFTMSAGQVACWTRITGAAEETFVHHVWKLDGVEKAKVQLSIAGPSWRTWSIKQLHPGSVGHWTVEIQDAQGVVLKTVGFQVE